MSYLIVDVDNDEISMSINKIWNYNRTVDIDCLLQVIIVVIIIGTHVGSVLMSHLAMKKNFKNGKTT